MSKSCFASALLLCCCALSRPPTEGEWPNTTASCSFIEVRIARVAVEDGVFQKGNDDNDFDHGEYVGVIVVVQNTGTATARDLEVEIISNAPNELLLRSGIRRLQALKPGEFAKAPFKVEARSMPTASAIAQFPLAVRVWGSDGVILLEAPLPLEMNKEPAEGEYDTARQDETPDQCRDPASEPTPTDVAPRRFGRAPAIAALGVGGAALALSLTADLLARSAYHDYEGDLSRPHSLLDSANRRRDIANVAAAIGVVGVATGLALFVVAAKSDSTGASTVSVAPLVAPSFFGLSAGGTY